MAQRQYKLPTLKDSLVKKLLDDIQKLQFKLEIAMKALKEIERVAKQNPAGWYETDEEIDSTSPEDATARNTGEILRIINKSFADIEALK